MDVPAELVTQSEYARHRGVSPAAIHKAIEAGRIPVQVHDGRKLIDPAEADLAWSESQQRVNVPREGGSDSSALNRAKTFGAVYDARLAQLKYERELGKALPLDGVVDASAACGEAVVRIMRSLSMRAEDVALAAGQGGVVAVRAALKGIERDMLARVSAAFTEMAARATAARAAEAALAGGAEDDGEGGLE